MDWRIQTDSDLTGFFIEHRRLSASKGQREDVLLWQKVSVDLKSTARSYQIIGLVPNEKYAFRVTAVNQRTIGYPSQAKRPGVSWEIQHYLVVCGFVAILITICCISANPPFRAYPAVIGAAVGGMILATVATAMLFVYVLRNRNTNPRESLTLINNKMKKGILIIQ